MIKLKALSRQISLALGNRITGLLIRLRLHRLCAAWLQTGVREWLSDGRVVPFQKNRRPDLPLVLVLQADRMPADIRILAQSPDLRVLTLNEPWLARVAYQFLPPGLGFSHYVVRDPIEPVRIGRARLRAFLRVMLPQFYRLVPADIVVRTDVKLQSDFDWCGVSAEIGMPYVVLQRENVFSKGRIVKFFNRDAATIFEGDHIITYGRLARDHYVKVGMTREDQVCALGCLRMDALIARVSAKPQRSRHQRITMFALEPEIFGHRGVEIDEMYRHVNAELMTFAREHPDIEVVIKLKKQRAKGLYVNRMRERILGLAKAEGWDASSLRNLLITAEGDAHNYIFNSDVVVGMNSSTILEGAVAGKPVIMPLFASMRTPEYLTEVDYSEDLGVFDLPRDRHELRAMLELRLREPVVGSDVMERRWQMFERYFHSRDGRARERIAAKLIALAAAAHATADRPVSGKIGRKVSQSVSSYSN